jgi:hypothetical protein
MARCSRCKCQNESVECRKFCQYHLDLFKKNHGITPTSFPKKQKRILLFRICYLLTAN